jgi:hypothetical protein
MLAEEAGLSGDRLSARIIAKRFRPPCGETQVRLALTHLSKLGLITSSFDNLLHAGFEISRSGLLKVEKEFDYLEVEGNNEFRLKSEEAIAVVDQKTGYKGSNDSTFVVQPTGGGAEAKPSASTPFVIYNHVSPIFNNSASAAPAHESGVARSGVRAGWLNLWVAVIFGLASLAVALWIAGKLPL